MSPRRNTALEEAEGRALRGENESQESQQIVERWRSEYGIGLLSSSPSSGDIVGSGPSDKVTSLPVSFPQTTHRKVKQQYVGSDTFRSTRPPPHLGRQPAPDAGVADACSKDHGAWATTDNTRASHHSEPTIALAKESIDAEQQDQEGFDGLTKELSRGDTAINDGSSSPLDLDDGGVVNGDVARSEDPVDSPNPLVRTDTLPRLPPSSGLAPRKMESSQQSPTQSNDGRSYEQYRHSSLAESTLPHTALVDEFRRTSQGPSLDTSPGHKTLNEDDTGAVNFSSGLFGNMRSHESQMSAPDTSAIGDIFIEHPQNVPVDAPETPAPPKNPFAAQSAAILLGGSQLFKQTQYSSAFRRISPTSSRPSPNDFHNNSISPNPIISSPLKARGLRTSPLAADMTSPQVPFSTSSQAHNNPETPYHDGTTKQQPVSSSPQYNPPKTRLGPELMDVYEPMRQSQERRETLELQDPPEDSEEDLSDDETSRRRRARSKKAEAERHLSSISFSRPSASISEDVEVPSTNKKAKSRSRTPAEEYVAECHIKADNDDESQETVADSQEQPIPNQEPRVVTGFEESTARSPTGSNVELDLNMEEASPSTSLKLTREVTASSLPGSAIHFSAEENNGDAIPETSPTDARPRAIGDILKQASSMSSKAPSFPTLQIDHSDHSTQISVISDPLNASQHRSTSGLDVTDRHYEPGSPAIEEYEPHSPSPGSAVGVDKDLPNLQLGQEQAAEQINSPEMSSSPPALRTRARSRVQTAMTEKHTPAVPSSSAPAGVLSSTSVLSSLSTTPALSNKTTPLTQDSVSTRRSNGLRTVVAESSPAVAKVRRQNVVNALPKLKTGTAENLRASSRLTRKQIQQDPSTDELAGSPSATPPLEHSLRNPRLGRGVSKSLPGSRDHSSRGTRIFEGMVFAISFQSRKQGESPDEYDERMEQSKSIEKKIQQGGGKVLSEGFEELFDASPVKSADTSPTTSQPGEELKLTSSAASGGFTALIADGHSRKVKYMQALALGLPCIAFRWITACFEKQEVVDWSPYLLCAGASSFLGDAIRSRNLTPYDPTSARLCDVIDRRTKLLEGNKILLVMKKSGESKRMAYVFLARVLGASLSRVYSVDEAKTKLKAAEGAGQPFDWVYVDEKTAGKGELFLANGAGEGKKRKRGSAGTHRGPPPKRVRTLSDELVVQSLIFGRMIEEGEMDG